MTAFVIPFQRLVQFHPGHLQTQILLACHRRLAKLRSLAGSRVSTGPQNPTNLTAYTRLWKTNHLFVSQHFSGLLLVDERWDKLSLWTKRRLVCCLLDKQWIPCAQSSWTAGHTHGSTESTHLHYRVVVKAKWHQHVDAHTVYCAMGHG